MAFYRYRMHRFQPRLNDESSRGFPRFDRLPPTATHRPRPGEIHGIANISNDVTEVPVLSKMGTVLST